MENQPDPSDLSDLSPFHRGEQQVQARVGVRSIETWARRVIRPSMPDEHRDFFRSLPFLVAAARDGEGRPWATLLVGHEGFSESPKPDRLEITTRLAEGDALTGALIPGAQLGLLGVELSTRRRNRVNGRIRSRDGDRHVFAVDQSFGNCPQYIRERAWRWTGITAPPAPRRSAELRDLQRRRILDADTFFIASGYRGPGESPSYGMDASHRGGPRGFVEVRGSTQLRFPDYSGNDHFNTIGNLSVDPRVGLLFVDFATGGMLQVSGRATIDWDSPEIATVPGARRLITVDIDAVVDLPAALPLRWSQDPAARLELRVVAVTRESADVTSLHLEAADGRALPTFAAGQHLPVELHLAGEEHPQRRTYSLSGSPRAAGYRITVKRQPDGRVSRALHDSVEVGSTLIARPPAGDFVIPEGSGPLVLLSAGVGLTPMVSMIHALAEGTEGAGYSRPILYVRGARDGDHDPLAAELRGLASKTPNIHLHVAYSRPRAEDQDRFDSAGRIDAALVSRLLRERSVEGPPDYLLCGPTSFMGQIQAELEAEGVDPSRIHSEAFGPERSVIEPGTSRTAR